MDTAIGFALEAAANSLSFFSLKATRIVFGLVLAAFVGWGIVSLF